LKKNIVRHLVLAFLAGGIVAAGAAEKVATVTETVNTVDHGASASSVITPAHVGTSLHDGDYLKTGAKSLAELELDNKTITRMGANTIFNYSVENNEVDLQAGTILFSKPKDGQQLNIKTAAVTAAVVGTTGFIQVSGNKFLFGLIEGHSKVFLNGKFFVVGPGQILLFIPGQQPVLFSFNVPQMISTSPLFTDFHHHLPNQRYIDEEIAAYLEDVSRGFIQPVSGTIYTFGTTNGLPLVDYPSFHNALNSLYQQYVETHPSTPPPNTCDRHHPCCDYGDGGSGGLTSDVTVGHHSGHGG
jgi:hypothetical protein